MRTGQNETPRFLNGTSNLPRTLPIDAPTASARHSATQGLARCARATHALEILNAAGIENGPSRLFQFVRITAWDNSLHATKGNSARGQEVYNHRRLTLSGLGC